MQSQYSSKLSPFHANTGTPAAGYVELNALLLDARVPQVIEMLLSGNKDEAGAQLDDMADESFCAYVAENIARQTGQRTLCTGGVYVDNPDEHQLAKLYENIDEMIRDWANFLTD